MSFHVKDNWFRKLCIWIILLLVIFIKILLYLVSKENSNITLISITWKECQYMKESLQHSQNILHTQQNWLQIFSTKITTFTKMTKISKTLMLLFVLFLPVCAKYGWHLKRSRFFFYLHIGKWICYFITFHRYFCCLFEWMTSIGRKMSVPFGGFSFMSREFFK